jgi:hypothetical protein
MFMASIKGMGPVLVLLILPAACGTIGASRQAHEAQIVAPRMTLSDLERRMGAARITKLPDSKFIAEWSYKEGSSSVSIPAPIGGVADVISAVAGPAQVLTELAGAGTANTSVSMAGDCDIIASVAADGNTVDDLRYAGADGGITGPHAVCAYLVRSLLEPSVLLKK